MQPPADGTVLRDLPKIWGAFLRHHLHTDIPGLNCTLTCRPDGSPFEFGRHPRPVPRKAAPRVFNRVIEGGHWPDNRTYRENDLDGTFNLYERVAEHVPGSQDWLFSELKRIALRQPLNEREIQESICRTLARFGLVRLDRKAACLIIELDADANFDISPSLLQTHWEALASYNEPLHATVLTLLMAEWRFFTDSPAEVYPYCVKAWANVLRRAELTADRSVQRVAIKACRIMLAHICLERRRDVNPLPIALRRHIPCCPIWAPDQTATSAEARLCEFYDVIQEEKRHRHGSNPRAFLAPKSSITVPDEIEGAVEVVCRSIIDSLANWASWMNSPKRQEFQH
ncbi:MAG: hypothetical protein ABIR16_03200 [Dokdonella sp.]